MTIFNSSPVDEICRRGSLSSIDVQDLRSVYAATDLLVEADAEALLAIHHACRFKDPAWSELMIEALTEYVVNDLEPRGYLNAANARWLIAHIAADGRIASRDEHALLVNILDKARWAPESLSVLALNEIRACVTDGCGPLRSGSGIEPCRITDGDVDLIRRILFAFGGGRPCPVSRAEAGVLLDVAEALSQHQVRPSWNDLLVKTMANVAFAASGYAVPRREEALMRTPGLDGRVEIATPLALRGGEIDLSQYTEQSEEERALVRLERQRVEIITGEAASEPDAAWLAGRLGRTGWPADCAMVLSEALKQQSRLLHESLQSVLSRREIAA